MDQRSVLVDSLVWDFSIMNEKCDLAEILNFDAFMHLKVTVWLQPMIKLSNHCDFILEFVVIWLEIGE